MKLFAFVVVALALIAAGFYWFYGGAQPNPARVGSIGSLQMESGTPVAAPPVEPAGGSESPSIASGAALSEKPASREAVAPAANQMRVVDSSGAPRPGVIIYFIEDRDVPGPGSWLNAPPPLRESNIQSTADGSFSLPGVGAGWVLARDPGVGWGFGSTSNREKPIVIERCGPIRIKTQTFDWKPLPSARVTLRRLPFTIELPSNRSHAETDAARRCLSLVEYYEMTSDTTGMVEVAGATSGLYLVAGDSAGCGVRILQLGLAAGETVEFDFSPAATVRGKVVSAETGEPLANVQVQVMDARSVAQAWSEVVQTAPTGEFSIVTQAAPFLNPHIRLRAFASGRAAAWSDIQSFTAGSEKYITIRMERGSEVSGSVVDAAGAPVAMASVFLSETDGGPFSDMVTANASGQFLFPLVPHSKKYSIFATASGFATAKQTIDGPGSMKEPIVLERGGSVHFVIQDFREEDWKDGLCSVWFRYDGRQNGTPGKWDRKKLPVAARMELLLDAPGFYTYTLHFPERAPLKGSNIEVPSGGSTAVAVRPETGATMRGRIIKKIDGSPVEGASVSFRLQPTANAVGPESELKTQSSADGSFILQNIPLGDADIVATTRAGGTAYKYFQVRDRGSIDAGDFAIVTPGSLKGKVQFESVPASPPEACVLSSEGQVLASRMVDGAGEFDFDQVAIGTYLIVLRAGGPGGNFIDEKKIEVTDSTAVRVELKFGSAAVRGSVKRGGVAPEGNWNVVIQDAATAKKIGERRIATDGAFELEGLAPGKSLIYIQRTDKNINSQIARPVNLAPGWTEAHFTLSGSVTTFIVKGRDGSPVHDVDVWFRLADGGMPLTEFAGATDEKGRLEVLDLEPGNYKLITVKKGYATNRQYSIKIESNIKNEAILNIRAESPLTVRAVESDGSGITSFQGAAREILPEPVRLSFRNSNEFGAAFVGQLGSGAHEVFARADGRFPNSLKTTLGDSMPSEVSLTLFKLGNVMIHSAPGALIRITAKGVAGSSDEWIQQKWMAANGRELVVGADGSLELTGLPATELTIAAGRGSAKVTLKEGETAEVHVLQ